MPSDTKLPSIDGDVESSSKALETLLSTGSKAEENKSLNPSNQGVEEIKSPRPSIKSEQGEENVEGNKSPRPSIKSEKGEENVEGNKSPRVSIKGEQGVENVEATELPQPSAVENASPQELQETPLTDVPKTVSEDDQNTPEQLENPRSKIVSLRDVNSVPSVRDEPSEGVLRSNKEVQQPSIKDLDPSVLPKVHSPRTPVHGVPLLGNSRSEMWLYAVLCIFLLTILMRFFMTNLKLFSVVLYSALVALLALRFVGHGPLASRRHR